MINAKAKHFILLASLTILLYFTIAPALIPNLGYTFLWRHSPLQEDRLENRSDYRFPLGVLFVTGVEEQHPAQKQLQQGDYLLAVDGAPLEAAKDWLPVFNPSQMSYNYQVWRGGEVIGTVDVPVTELTLQHLLNRIRLGLLALPAWIIGALLIYYGRRGSRDAWVVGALMLAGSIALAAFGASRFGIPFNFTALVPLLPLFAAIAIHSALLPRDKEGNDGALHTGFRLLYLVAGVMAGLALVDIYFIYPQGQRIEIAGTPLYGWSLMSLAVGLLSIPAILLVRYLQLKPSYQRRQVGILLAFTGTAAVAFTLFTYIPDVLWRIQLLPESLTIPLLLLFPLGYAYVIFRWRYLNLDHLVTRTFTLLLFGLILAAGYSLLFYALSTQFVQGPVASTLFVFIATIGTPWASRPIRDFVHRLIYGPDVSPDKVLDQFSEVVASDPDIDTMRELLATMPDLLDVSQAALIIRDDQGQLLLVETDNMQQLDWTQQQQPDLSNEDFVVRSSSTDLGMDSLFAAFPWSEALLPLRVGDRFQGYLLLGQPVNGGHYNARQVHMLRKLANIISLTAETILLFSATRDMAFQLLKVRDSERTVLANRIHDGPLHKLTLVTSIIKPRQDPLRKELVGVSNQLRDIISGLSSPVLQNDFQEVLEELAEEFEVATGIKTHVRNEVSEDRFLPYETSNAFYHVMQAALHNVQIHSNASIVEIAFVQEADRLRLTVFDNGTNGALPKHLDSKHLIQERHYGLVGMSQWALGVRGTWQIEHRPEGGVMVTMTAPLKRQFFN